MASKYGKDRAMKRNRRLQKEIAEMFAEYDFHTERNDDLPRRSIAVPTSIPQTWDDEENQGMEDE